MLLYIILLYIYIERGDPDRVLQQPEAPAARGRRPARGGPANYYYYYYFISILLLAANY